MRDKDISGYDGQHEAALTESQVIELWESQYCLSREQAVMVEPDDRFQYLLYATMMIVLILGFFAVSANGMEQVLKSKKRAGKCAAANMRLSFNYMETRRKKKIELEEQANKGKKFIDDNEERDPTKYET
ncbi:unnamed protein product [Bursaphelenchus xylophilus]|uniref:(pine wood nematode) hypothetical protein n=1 Tax=Bursaphelenchus xylophilus TaxID=6326 RepID=A0A1I7RT49_BURXY|nr:unnamed protein product [Bursaphelenchus xylophilus]CAG9122612.1 unnamed protein product [Bursaphelenchus xylophilus]